MLKTFKKRIDLRKWIIDFNNNLITSFFIKTGMIILL